MLPDSFFHPLKPTLVIDAAYDEFGEPDDFGEPADESAARETVRQVLLDPRSQGDPGVFELAWELVDLYDDDELPEAVELLTEVLNAHPDQRFALGALRAAYRDAEGVPEMEALHRDLSLLLPERRDVRFYYLAPAFLAEHAHPDRGAHLAREGAALARSLGLEAEAERIEERSPDPEHRRQSRARLEDLLSTAATPYGKRAFGAERSLFRMVYLPAGDYARGLAEGLLDATFPLDHEDYRRELESSLHDSAELGKISVVAIDLAEVDAFAERTGRDPRRRSTRLAYLSTLPAHDAISWPPERNAPCWCGSERKYKKCCGRPGFRDQPVPDRGRAVLRVDGPHPLRVQVPSRIRLDRLRELIDADAGARYSFSIQDGGIDADQAANSTLSQLANEPGQSFGYHNDRDHRVTLEEILPVDPADNQPRVI
ncbi:SEC-C metal-binding domain-containing protein [Nonomuraea sp. NPDC059194]|uniref:SEC-C metal-binding domain-containing protein n=1 Tax=Nonomuraea sp. NPDC059194 TaxID=3346764 RepID=UPI0036AD82C6